MSVIRAELFDLPAHHIRQRQRTIPNTAHVRISSRQDVKAPSGTAAQRAGMRYENRVGKQLKKCAKAVGATLHEHVWISAGGKNYQPDYFMTFPSKSVLLFEVKQTWVDTCTQLSVYRELLSRLGYDSITTCTICRNLTPETPRSQIIYSFSDISEDSVWLIRV